MPLPTLWLTIFAAVMLSSITGVMLHKVKPRTAVMISSYPILALIVLAAIWRRMAGVP